MANLRIGRRSGLVLRGGRNRRSTLWVPTTTTTITISSGATAVLAFSGNALLLAFRPFTVIRSRFYWYCRSDVVTGGELWGGAIGQCVVSEQAEAIGVTAVPIPITDMGSDLFFMIEQQFGRFGGTQVEEVGKSKEIDSRAMRKVNEDEQLIITMESGATTESISMINVFGGRNLIKLH